MYLLPPCWQNKYAPNPIVPHCGGHCGGAKYYCQPVKARELQSVDVRKKGRFQYVRKVTYAHTVDLNSNDLRMAGRNAIAMRQWRGRAQHVDLKTVVDGASGLVLSPSYLSGAIAYRLVCAAASLVAR